MSSASVDCVSINVDLDWETQFIPWLEEMERNNVGVEDGVFLATVDPALRVFQPEEETISTLLKNVNPSHFSAQKVTEFRQSGIFLYSAHIVFQDDSKFDKIKKEFIEKLTPQSFKTATCCTSFSREDGVCQERLLNHFHYDVLNISKNLAHTGRSFGSAKSVVMLEESGLKIEQTFKKYSQNTDQFLWEKGQKSPPGECPDLECAKNYSDFDLNDDNGTLADSKKRPKIKEEIIGWYGTCHEDPNNSLKVTPKLKLCRIFNLLWLLPHHYMGLHSSYLYLGTTHSLFPIHVEDGNLLSVNYLLFGHPKVWVVIPPWATELLEFHLHKSCISLDHSSCRNILGHKSVVPTICWLKERKIPFKTVVQHPGQMVVLHASAAHFGFNSGPNVAQAINIATKSWIPWGINAKKCACLPLQVHLDVSPLVAAFRGDLLSHVLQGGVVITPSMLRGIQLLKDEVFKSSNVMLSEHKPLGGESINTGEESPRFKCPVQTCPMTFPQTPVEIVKSDMIKHVKTCHRPFLQKSDLLSKVNSLFGK